MEFRLTSQVRRYSFALALLALALLVRVALAPWLGSSLSHPTIFTAVLIVAWYWGSGPAWFIAVLGYPAIEYFVLSRPFGEWSFHYIIPSLGLYGGLNAIIIGFVSRFRGERDRLLVTQERLSLLSGAVESAANSIVLTDDRGIILWVNPAFSKLTGYGREEVVGRKTSVLKSGKQTPDFYESLWKTILRGDVWRGQLVNRRKDGSLYYEEMTITPVRASGGGITHFVGIKENITERRQAEEALQAAKISSERAKQIAEEANRAKDRFLAVLSHELRTPLAPVLSGAQVLQRMPGLTDQMRELLEVIQRNVQLEARLIDDLLDLTRIASGKILLENKVLDVCSVLTRAIETCKPDMEARKLTLSTHVLSDGVSVHGDASRLQQVFWNLLKNSIKFTPDGGSISIHCRKEGGQAVIEVADNGIGIEPEAMDRIFNAFEQESVGTTQRFGGLGLGLAITRRLVEMHGGYVSAHSPGRNQGATFRVSLPAVEGIMEAETAQARHPRSVLISKHILLVEDHGDTAKMMQALLSSAGYQVDLAGDVEQALSAVKGKQYDLLISDLGLPDGSGLELMQRLRQGRAVLRGIALSGFGQEEDVKRSHEVGYSLHLTKPVDFDALLEAVEGLLR